MIDKRQTALEEANAKYVEAQDRINEQLRQAEIERAKKIDEAAARGEVLDIPHADPQAAAAVNVTSARTVKPKD